MAMLDVAAAAEYGLQAAYLDKLFTGKITLGNVSTDYQKYESCYTKNTWGTCQSRYVTAQRNQSAKFDGNSTLSGTGYQIKGSTWLDNLPEISEQAHYLLQNANQHNPAGITGVVLNSGNSNSRPDPLNLYLDESNFDPGGITFVTKNSKNATVGEGRVTTSLDQLASGASASQTFTFIPGATPVIELSFTSTNSVEQVTSRGTTNTASTGGSGGVTAGLKVGVESTQQAGIEFKGLSAGVETSQSIESSIEASYHSSWNNVKSVDYSKAKANVSENSSTITITLDLNNMKETDNGDYDYTIPPPQGGSQPQANDSQTKATAKFVPGGRYKASIIYNQAKVETVVTGDYEIAGTIGSITDNTGQKANTISMSAAAAIDYARQHNGETVVGLPPATDPSLGSLNGARTSIPFQGSAIFGTAVQSNFTTNFYAVGNPSASLESTKTKSTALKNKTQTINHYDLGLIDHNYHETGVGNWLSLTTLDGEKSVIDGGNSAGNSVIEASYEGRHKFINHTNSFLVGNNQKDIVKLDDGYSGNNIDLKEGNDKVITSEGQTVILGAGNDTYVIEGGKGHQITLGEGRDVVVIKSLDDVGFAITDFDWVEDQIKLGGELKKDNLEAKLVNRGDLTNLDGARLEFVHNDNIIGSAMIAHDTDSYKALSDAHDYFDLLFLNAKYVDLEPMFGYLTGEPLPNQAELFEQQVISNNLFKKTTIAPSDWTTLSVRDRAKLIDNAMKSLGGETGIDYWVDVLNKDGILATNHFDSDMISTQIWPYAGLDIVDLGT